MDLRSLGNKGERIAADFLKKKDYQIIAKQYRTRVGEIDLVAKDGEEVVFVEVKTITTKSFGHPEESVTEKKLMHIARTAELFLKEHAWEEKPFRIDVIAIFLDGESVEIEHFESVDMS